MSDKHLTLELVTPEKVAWSASADLVVLPAADGEMGVLPGHMPFLVQLGAGEVRVTDKGAVVEFNIVPCRTWARGASFARGIQPRSSRARG